METKTTFQVNVKKAESEEEDIQIKEENSEEEKESVLDKEKVNLGLLRKIST